MLRMDLDRLGDERVEVEAELRQHEQRHQRRAGEQQPGLDDLHPGRSDHAAEGDVDDHQDADDHDSPEIGQTEQKLDELARADHLRNQIEGDRYKRAGRRHRADGRGLQTIGGDVGEGEATEVAQRLGHQEHDERPADEEADRVDQAVIAAGVDQRRDAEERGGRHVVARDREAVLEAGNAAARRVEVLGRPRALSRPVGDAERHDDEGEEDDDGVPVGRLDRAGLDRAGGKSRSGANAERPRKRAGSRGKLHHFFPPSLAALTIALVRSSYSLLARMT